MIKNIFSTLALLLVAVSVTFAQDATSGSAPVIKSKKGENYLPETDEWALGVSASPFLDYVGNFVSGWTAKNAAPTFNFATNVVNTTGVPSGAILALFGKKMVDANTAYRVRFNIGMGTRTNKAVVAESQLNPNPAYPAFAEDWQKIHTKSIVIAPGIEKRRGTTRLQGIYGAELIIGYANTKVEYEYGNPQTADFTAPASFDFSGSGFGANLVGPGSSVRVTEDKQGASMLVGARGFIGVEYFIVPKLSISGEFGYMISYRSQRRGLLTTETFDNATLSTRVTETDRFNNGGQTNVGIGLDNITAALNLMFYF